MSIEQKFRSRKFAPNSINEGFSPYLEWMKLSGVFSETRNTTALKAHKEVMELDEAIIQHFGRLSILSEFADVANFAASLGAKYDIDASTFSSNGLDIDTFDELHDYAEKQIKRQEIIKPKDLLPNLHRASEQLIVLTEAIETRPEALILPLHELMLGATMGAHLLAANIGDMVILKHFRNMEVKYTLEDLAYLMNQGKSIAEAQEYLAKRYRKLKYIYFRQTGKSFDDDFMRLKGFK